MSFCAQAMVAVKKAVLAPTTVTMPRAKGAYSISGDIRAIMNTPAVTIVAAWISAETGVGPSIASGSQVCRPSCADLPIAPTNNRMQASVSEGTCQPRKYRVVATAEGALAKTVSKFSDP